MPPTPNALALLRYEGDNGTWSPDSSLPCATRDGHSNALIAVELGLSPTPSAMIRANLVKQGVASKEGQQYAAVSR